LANRASAIQNNLPGSAAPEFCIEASSKSAGKNRREQRNAESTFHLFVDEFVGRRHEIARLAPSWKLLYLFQYFEKVTGSAASAGVR
jgi:hypothetical protein